MSLRISMYLILERAINDAYHICDEELELELERAADSLWLLLDEKSKQNLLARSGPTPEKINPINISSAAKPAMEQIMNQQDDRYQNQPFYIKFWRMRHYLMVPFYFIYGIFFGWRTSFAWAIAVSRCQADMKYYFTQEEVLSEVKEILTTHQKEKNEPKRKKKKVKRK